MARGTHFVVEPGPVGDPNWRQLDTDWDRQQTISFELSRWTTDGPIKLFHSHKGFYVVPQNWDM